MTCYRRLLILIYSCGSLLKVAFCESVDFISQEESSEANWVPTVERFPGPRAAFDEPPVVAAGSAAAFSLRIALLLFCSSGEEFVAPLPTTAHCSYRPGRLKLLYFGAQKNATYAHVCALISRPTKTTCQQKILKLQRNLIFCI